MNNYGILLNTIPYNLKKKIRSLERYDKKINNITWSIMFNQTSLKEDIDKCKTNCESIIQKLVLQIIYKFYNVQEIILNLI